jgi:cell wall assembly regulator SMI1
MTPMDAIWSRIETWLQAHAPEIADGLNFGASEEDLVATERFLGVTFPDDVRSSFRRHDGQAPDSLWLMDGWELLSLERVGDEWVVWKDLLDGGAFRDCKSQTDSRVVQDWWHPQWIPLTYNGAGDHHCLDLHPGPSGTVGQIIQMWHDDAIRPVLASSYRQWLAAFAAGLEAGDYVVSDEYGGLVRREDV